jgi:hypothetical protein
MRKAFKQHGGNGMQPTIKLPLLSAIIIMPMPRWNKCMLIMWIFIRTSTASGAATIARV